MLPTLLAASVLVFYLAIAVLLIRKYLRTRDVAFIWLGVAVLVWPVVSRLLLDPLAHLAIDRLTHGEAIGLFPFTLVEHGRMTLGTLVVSMAWAQELVGICLLFIAVLYLSKAHTHHGHQPA